MPHRCVAGECSNMRKDGVSLHKWPEDLNVAKQWTKAVKNTRSDFFNPATDHICSAHFTADSFEDQSVIAKSLGLKMKNILKPNAVPTIFNRLESEILQTESLRALEEGSARVCNTQHMMEGPRALLFLKGPNTTSPTACRLYAYFVCVVGLRGHPYIGVCTGTTPSVEPSDSNKRRETRDAVLYTWAVRPVLLLRSLHRFSP